MSRILVCLACGAESRDVSMRLVELPEGERRFVQTATPSAENQHGVTALEYRDVPERYVNEPRCRDTAACKERVWAMRPLPEPAPEPAPEPEPPAEPEIPAWL
jgi:hypothetical protein